MACRSSERRARSYRIVVRGSAWEAASWTSRRATPASRAAVMNECRSECGVTRFSIPAPLASLRTIRVAACRSSRRLASQLRKIGPSSRSPTQIDGPSRAGSQRDGDDLAALPGDGERSVAAFHTEVFDVGTERLGDP